MSEVSCHKFYEMPHAINDVTQQLRNGLLATVKSISPKFFYDKKGSELFALITRTPEYYLTRTEISILNAYGHEMASLIGQNSVLIEYGAGNGEKIRLLLDCLKPTIYAPLDISRDYLYQSANAIAKEYPWLEVHAVCVDYNRAFRLPFTNGDRPVAGFFPGSSIGNFEPQDAIAFLRCVKSQLGAEAGLLIGVDLKKDLDILNAAYNDAEGITAEFNINILSHINQVYGADFALDAFTHQAFFNRSLGCIQMFLESQRDQTLCIADQAIDIASGEQIHTENSFKYTRHEFVTLAEKAGFKHSQCWTDPRQWFAIFYLT